MIMTLSLFSPFFTPGGGGGWKNDQKREADILSSTTRKLRSEMTSYILARKWACRRTANHRGRL